MLVGFARYSRDSSYAVLRANRAFVLAMASGWLVGAAIGGVWLGAVPSAVLLPALAAILSTSAFNMWRRTR